MPNQERRSAPGSGCRTEGPRPVHPGRRVPARSALPLEGLASDTTWQTPARARVDPPVAGSSTFRQYLRETREIPPESRRIGGLRTGRTTWKRAGGKTKNRSDSESAGCSSGENRRIGRPRTTKDARRESGIRRPRTRRRTPLAHCPRRGNKSTLRRRRATPLPGRTDTSPGGTGPDSPSRRSSLPDRDKPDRRRGGRRSASGSPRG